MCITKPWNGWRGPAEKTNDESEIEIAANTNESATAAKNIFLLLFNLHTFHYRVDVKKIYFRRFIGIRHASINFFSI